MKDNCFTILCWFLSFINMNQSPVYIWPLPLVPLPHLSPLCTPEVVTGSWFEPPVSYSKFPLAIYFTCDSVYVFNLLSSSDFKYQLHVVWYLVDKQKLRQKYVAVWHQFSLEFDIWKVVDTLNLYCMIFKRKLFSVIIVVGLV